MFEGLVAKNTSSIITTGMFFLRRYILVVILIFGQNNGMFQMCCYQTCNCLVLLFTLRYTPFDTELRNQEALLHEGACFAFGYFLLGFSNAIPDDHTRFNFGWAPIAFILVYASICVYLILKENLRLSKMKLKFQFRKCRHRC